MRLLLVHGMGRTVLSLSRLTRYLQQTGYRPERVGYVAALEGFERIRARVRHRLEAFARAGEPYAVIGHSLGGLALRAALWGLEPAPVHLIMLAFAQLPPPTMPYTIIAGSAGPCGPRSPFGYDTNDWIVTVDETKIAPADRPTVFQVGHTFMMNDRQVHAAIRRALEQAKA